MLASTTKNTFKKEIRNIYEFFRWAHIFKYPFLLIAFYKTLESYSNCCGFTDQMNLLVEILRDTWSVKLATILQ